MMKTVLLLAFAVFVSGASVKEDKIYLGELVQKLTTVLKNLPEEPKGKEIYLKDLKMSAVCSKHMFCEAEQELLKVSSLTKYTDFRTDGTLMRILNTYNKRHVSTCKPVDKDQEQIPLEEFLGELKKCAQIAYSKNK